MSKYKLKKFAEYIDEETAKEFYRNHKKEIDNLSRRQDSKYGGINSSGRVIDDKTYRLWANFLKTKKFTPEFMDYRKFHEWLIKQHGYGNEEMYLNCIDEVVASDKTIFFLPKKLSLTIRPSVLNHKGVISKFTGFQAKVGGKSYGLYDTHEQAQQAARKAMVARIHTIMEEHKHLISKEAYEAIKAI